MFITKVYSKSKFGSDFESDPMVDCAIHGIISVFNH